jgi:hypothetical protein
LRFGISLCLFAYALVIFKATLGVILQAQFPNNSNKAASLTGSGMPLKPLVKRSLTGCANPFPKSENLKHIFAAFHGVAYVGVIFHIFSKTSVFILFVFIVNGIFAPLYHGFFF